MKITYKFSILLLFFVLAINAKAQIIANGNTDETTSVDSYPIFLFSDLTLGTISATPPAGGTTITYTWYTYSASGWNQIQSGNNPTLNASLQETGYRVNINVDGSSVNDYYCWVFQPEITSAEVETTIFTCDDLQLSVIPESKVLTYYNLTNGSAISLNYSYNYIWESSPTGDIDGLTEATPKITSPYEDTSYDVTISVFNGAATLTASIDIEAIAVSADFSYAAADRDNYNETDNLDNKEGSAPISVSFTSESLGTITDYEWNFVREDDDYNYAPHLEANTNFTFEEAGTYNVSLMVSNVLTGCSSIKTLDTPLVITEMEIDAPNVFTPDGDGINDEFVVVYHSVKSFKMVIVNRWGRKVFTTNNPAEGWDGKINGKKASEGVYFYYIEAKGYNESERKELKGPLHLIRGK